jgi:hypothetical protein
MSVILRLFGLEPPEAVKAARAESQEAFNAQLRERSVTRASREHTVVVGHLARALERAVEESKSVRIDRDLSGRRDNGHGHAD